MKKNIHPEYKDIVVTCACGETFTTKSTSNAGEMKIEVCNKCHPMFTGKQKVVDTSGRIEKFKNKFKLD